VAALVDIGELDGLPDLDRAGVRGLLADEHAEQGGLAGAVGANDPDDPRRWRRDAPGKASPVVTDEPVARGAPSSAGSPASPSLWRMPDHAPERQHRRPAARCLTCSQPVSHGVVRYCQQHAARFGGAVYCMPCQQHFSTATA
ncbi:MAG TPA: hypothetical protein VM305_07800, partial [Candidatus Limnocylindrales bacterium]|nr:hypothetical protein [Candidatus Limnocylindrales bacterium]